MCNNCLICADLTGVWRNVLYRGADKSLSRPGGKRAQKHVREACDFNNIETSCRQVFSPLQGKVPKEIPAILTVTLTCFLPGQAKDLSAPLYINVALDWRSKKVQISVTFSSS